MASLNILALVLLIMIVPNHDLRALEEQQGVNRRRSIPRQSSWTPISPTDEVVQNDVAFAVSEINRIKKGVFRKPLMVKAACILLKEYVSIDFVLGYTTCEVGDSTPPEKCQLDPKKVRKRRWNVQIDCFVCFPCLIRLQKYARE